MTGSEAAALDQLPDLLNVWRAVPAASPAIGFSFFLDESSARAFAATARTRLELPEGTFALMQGRMQKPHVIALSQARGMPELLAPPAKIVGETHAGTV